MNYLPYYVQPRMDKNASRFSRKAILKGKQGKCSESPGGWRRVVGYWRRRKGGEGVLTRWLSGADRVVRA